MSDPSLLTVLLNYKTADMTLRAAEAVRTAMEGIRGEIIIVDNDSQDGSFEAISAHVTEQGWDRDGRVRVIADDLGDGTILLVHAYPASVRTFDFDVTVDTYAADPPRTGRSADRRALRDVNRIQLREGEDPVREDGPAFYDFASHFGFSWLDKPYRR